MNDYQYERMEAEFSRVIEDAEDRIKSDAVNVYPISGGKFGVEVVMDGEFQGDRDLGGEEEILSFAEELGAALDEFEKAGIDRDQPLFILGFLKDWA